MTVLVKVPATAAVAAQGTGKALNPEDQGDGWEAFEPLTPEQARALRERLPALRPWHVVLAQAAMGLLCSLVCWGVTRSEAAGLSALYGGLTVVVPQALLARGMSVRSGANPGAAAFGFVLWELIKIAVTVAMLAAAVWVVPRLSWPALLVTMVVCMKVSWLALLWRRPGVAKTNERRN